MTRLNKTKTSDENNENVKQELAKETPSLKKPITPSEEQMRKDDEAFLNAEQEQAKAKTSDERTYVLRLGETAQFPIKYPNGETIVIKFENGMKVLSGRLARLFHAEYMSNPHLRSKVAEVVAEVADNVAKQYRKANKRVATPGLDSAQMSPQALAAAKDAAQMRYLQRRAGEGKIDELLLPQDVKTELEA